MLAPLKTGMQACTGRHAHRLLLALALALPFRARARSSDERYKAVRAAKPQPLPPDPC